MNPSPSVVGINIERVTDWLDSNIETTEGPYQFDFIEGGRSNLTYRVTDANGISFVLRRPPTGMVLATAHDMGREFRVISGISKSTVPVPDPLGLCTDEAVNDAPFYVMSYVDGVVLHDEESVDQAVPEMAPRMTVSEESVDVLARLHAIDPASIGLSDLGRTEDYVGRQLKRWNRQWEATKTRELPQMDEAFAELVSSKPAQVYSGVVHGDYRLGNMLLDPATGSIRALLDWELCTLGDVLADLGYLLNSWVQPGENAVRGATTYPTTKPGFSTREQLIKRYSEQTGFDTTGINYYRAFQNWRLAAIIEGVLARYLQGVMADEVDTGEYSLQVEQLATDALDLLD